MSTTWLVVLLVGAATVALKGLAPCCSASARCPRRSGG